MSFSKIRKFTRVPLETRIRVSAPGGGDWPSRSRNVSLGGMFIQAEQTLDPGIHCTLEMASPGLPGSPRIRVDGEIVRSRDEGMAVEFTSIDSDSLVHLWDLIKHCADDPRTIDKEYFRDLFEIEPPDRAL